MQIQTGFKLAYPVSEAWPLLTDLERVAPSMPGVKVDSADDEGLRATMRVKVGPVTASYRTLVTVESLDEYAHTAVLKASGRETRGPGTVEATVTAAMRPDGDMTDVDLKTDLAVTGKVAQFGGGVMKEVADRLLGEFAVRLEADLATGPGAQAAAAAAPANGSATAATQPSSSPHATEPEPVDLGRIAGRAMAPRIAVAGGLLLLLLLLLRRRR
jgi:uncharacterized protein